MLFLCGGRHCAVYAPMLTLVLGGAASGKSEYAETLVLHSALPRYYLATMQVWDAECAARVEKHRKMRAAKQFETLECPLHLETVRLPRRGTALLEDLGNLTANELYDPAGAGDAAAEHILQGLDALAVQCENLIVVSNEVFSGGADYAGDTDRYLLALAGERRAPFAVLYRNNDSALPLIDALERAGITLDADDYTEPALNDLVTVGSKIVVHRVDYQDKVETQTIPYDTEYVYTSLYFRNTGRTTTLQHGSEGQQTVTTRERYVDGELENSMVVDVTTTAEPTNHVVKTYGAGAPVSPLTGPDGTTNPPSSYSQVLTGKATGYYSKSGKGSSGLGLGYGTVAVDPSVIPYGTLLYITSTDGSFVYGYAVATDTGIALQNGHILVDLFYETYAESVINGAIQVNVYVVN